MKAGVSMTKVAKACGRTVKSVSHWCEGGDPKDLDARIVLALYRRYCPEQYVAHMREFEPDVLEIRPVVMVDADRSIRGRPRPRKVAVTQTVEDHQRLLFVEVA
ncbi:hypothetical protein RD110_08015 [Rhodoferax koreense]|uniref:Uncharacterized protein n=2 Tax=Rhodoferax koreensis TaxID=1842727 RepID=A0A1P8JTR7_9BURK|nr:hypothetical protein RD110_08015 [Rhodoferax koreense]